jgi:hypothetical protein
MSLRFVKEGKYVEFWRLISSCLRLSTPGLKRLRIIFLVTHFERIETCSRQKCSAENRARGLELSCVFVLALVLLWFYAWVNSLCRI